MENNNEDDGVIDWDLMANHPAFVTEIDPTNMHPATKALQAFKFESEDPYSNAFNYKEDGNYLYKNKQFSKAIASYTAGLDANANDPQLNASLFTNRAICHFYLENFRSCIHDCKSAVKLFPTYLKAYMKGIDACLAISKIDEALELASDGLVHFPDSAELLKVQIKALAKQMEMDKRSVAKEQVEIRKQDEEMNIYAIIEARGIQINRKLKPVDIPDASKTQFYVDTFGKFHWSVLFMYPEFGQTDFLRDVIETTKIRDCLKIVFDPNETPPSWDLNRLYSIDSINHDDTLELYFEDVTNTKRMISFPSKLSIHKLCKSKGFHVRRDLLIIIHVVSKRSVKFFDRWKSSLSK